MHQKLIWIKLQLDQLKKGLVDLDFPLKKNISNLAEFPK